MKTLLAGAVLAASLMTVAPASAQRIDIGPGGPSVDLRNRAQRERDYDRMDSRRDRDRRMYREQRYQDRGERSSRRGY
ncbi:MAG TPA: hypothetical protein VF641_08800 [Methylobacterium sp.]